MKYWISKTVCVLNLFLFIQLPISACDTHIKPYPKTYLQEGQVTLVDDEIWVSLDDDVVCPAIIYIDGEGSYFDEVRLSKWWCWNCWWLNKEEAYQCSVCHITRPYPDADTE